MGQLLSVRGATPLIDAHCFVASTAIIAGEVTCGEYCSFWFGSITRGDVGSIHIGRYSNIQDGAVIHATFMKSKVVIGDFVSIGHNAVVHGAKIKDHVLVGMASVVLDNAIIEPYCIIAAGAVVLENFTCESGFIYAGVPAQKIKPLSTQQITSLDETPLNYVLYASWFTVGEGEN